MRNDRRHGHDLCHGPYVWASDRSDQGALCDKDGCTRIHPDHARRLDGTGGYTDFCVICMENHK